MLCGDVKATMENFIVADVQGFKTVNNKFIFKELAISKSLNEKDIQIFLFKPPNSYHLLPAKYKSENYWLRRNFHGLCWDDGNVSYSLVKDILRKHLQLKDTIVYVKGIEKLKWFQEALGDSHTKFINVEDLQCPSFEKLKMECSYLPCIFHEFIRNTPNCARENVKLIQNFLKRDSCNNLSHLNK